MEKLKASISFYLDTLKENDAEAYSDLQEKLKQDDWVAPFSKASVVLGALLSANVITFEQFIELKDSYEQRNKFLFTFEMSGPRTFGESWAQSYLNEIVPALVTPSKTLDSSYSGEYDFWYEGIKIEVKASRAVEDNPGGKLVDKALYSFDTDKKFNMNFQQIKPDCCDVFVWMGVWCDEIRYWVLSSSEVANNPHFSPGQHRGNTGEGQLMIKHTNIDDFDSYLVKPAEILNTIIEKSQR